jgi:hypothetical protein
MALQVLRPVPAPGRHQDVASFVHVCELWDEMRLYNPSVTEALEPDPVFVDRTGRRRRLARNAGIALGCVLAAYLTVVVFGLVSGADAPLTPWPKLKPSHHAVLPGHGGSAARQDASRPVARPTPSAVPGRRAGAPGPQATATTAPSTTASSAQPGQGHAYGRTKSPHPKRP